MSLDLNEIQQQTLFVQSDYRTHVNIPKDHPLVTLNQSLPWKELMEQAEECGQRKTSKSVSVPEWKRLGFSPREKQRLV